MALIKLDLNKVDSLTDHLARVFHVSYSHILFTTVEEYHQFIVVLPITTNRRIPVALLQIRNSGVEFTTTQSLSLLQEYGIITLAENCIIRDE